MFPSYLLSLREGLEAAFIVGLVLGVLRRIDRPDGRRVVWSAVACAATTCVLAATALHALGWTLAGPLEPIFEGITLLFAAGLQAWMIFWMGRQARGLKAGLEAEVGHAMSLSSHRGLFALSFIAVAREGLELAIFLTVSAFDSDALATFGAALLGLGTAAFLAWLLFAGSTRLNLKRFFQLTNGLLLALGAGLFAKAVHEFNEVGWIPALVDPIWDSSALVSDQSAWGHGLKTLFGYRSQPSLTVALAYGAYLLVVMALWSFARRPAKPAVAHRHSDDTHAGAASSDNAAPPSFMRHQERARSVKFGPVTDW